MRFNDTAIGISVAFGVTLLLNAPAWHAALFSDELSRPDIVTESSDEEFYLTRIREAADGHARIGHPYMFERRDQRYPLGGLWEASLGFGMHTSGMNLKTTAFLADALFPVILVLLLWIGVKPILPDKRHRLLLVVGLFLGHEMTQWKRPISPQATTVLPLVYLWALLSPHRAKLSPTALRGTLIGLMMHSYPFHWTYCITVEALLTMRLLHVDPAWKDRGLRLLAVGAPLCILAAPWLLSIIAMQGNGEYPATLARLGLIDRRLPAGIPLQMILLAAAAFTFMVRRTHADKRPANMILLLLAAGLVVLNQPLVTGKEAEFSPHYRQILIFPLLIAAVYALHSITAKRRGIDAIIVCAGLMLIGIQTFKTVRTDMTAYELKRTDTASRDARMELMTALNALPGEHVILTDDPTGRDTAIYTSHYPFFVHETHMYLADDAMLFARAAVQQAVDPARPIPSRAVVGSSALNRALYERTLCTIRSAFDRPHAPCTFAPEKFLPDAWTALHTTVPTPEESMRILREAHVSHVLLKNPPAWLLEGSTDHTTVGDHRLFRPAFAPK